MAEWFLLCSAMLSPSHLPMETKDEVFWESMKMQIHNLVRMLLRQNKRQLFLFSQENLLIFSKEESLVTSYLPSGFFLIA